MVTIFGINVCNRMASHADILLVHGTILLSPKGFGNPVIPPPTQISLNPIIQIAILGIPHPQHTFDPESHHVAFKPQILAFK